MLDEHNNGTVRSILELGVDPISIIITATVTIAFSVLGSLVNNNTTLYTVCDKGFYISLSIIILQALIQNFFLKEDTNSLKMTIKELNLKIKSTECVVFPERKSYINNRIEDALNSHKVKKMKIICYGTSKYGRIIDAIITTHTTVEVDVIVCSPDETFFEWNSDKQMLKNVIEELSMADNIHIFASMIPPTIRACVMYDNDQKPIWCSMQSYYLFPDENYKLFKGEGFSPSIISDSENELMLIHLVNIFNKEYDRLMEKSDKITPEIIEQRCKEGTW